MKGYKAFNEDLTCNGFQYEIGKEYEIEGELELCKNGFHFCKEIGECYNYYKPIESISDKMREIRICRVEAIGEVITDDNIKYCTSKIKILSEITGNKKRCNITSLSGGYLNTNKYNTGAYNTGTNNSGNWNTGFFNSGNENSGSCNYGIRNSGMGNIGDYNTGDYNKGKYNTGNWNTGNCNSGNNNKGKCNSGEFNSGNFNSGVFNTERNPKIKMFNKESDWTIKDWDNSKARKILLEMPAIDIDFIDWEDMDKNERQMHPEAHITGKYVLLKECQKSDRQKWWDELADKYKKAIISLPNFDPEIFYQCTGIRPNYEK